MGINEIFKLIDAGFTKEDIIELSKPIEEQPVKAEDVEVASPEENSAVPNMDYIKDLQKSVDDLKKTIIATNQLRDLGGDKTTTIDDINEYLINGRNKK